MDSLRIGIIEDEVLTTMSISILLKKMGHEVVTTHTRFETVFPDLAKSKPDLFLIDIRLKGKKTGLDIAKELNMNHGIPFLFLTSNTDSATVREAMETLPIGYITKPFTYGDLFIGIELAKAKISLGKPVGRAIEIKNGYETEWLQVDTILYLEADRSYVNVYSEKETRVLRQSLGKFLDAFEPSEIIRIHRSFAINPRKIESVSASKVIVNGQKLPLGPGYRERFEQTLLTLHE